MAKTTLIDAYAPECPIRNVLARFADKWGLLVLHTLTLKEKSRFMEIHKQMPDISKRMLSKTLKVLVADGLVERTEINTVPPTVEYNLSEIGKTLIPHIIGLLDWGREHMKPIMEHRLKDSDSNKEKSGEA